MLLSADFANESLNFIAVRFNTSRSILLDIPNFYSTTMTKGKPNARSQSYKAILQIQDKIKSTPMTSGNDDFPSPISIRVIQDEGAQRIIDTINVLHHSLARLVSSNDMLL